MSVLRNRLGLTEPDQLDRAERRLVAQRIAEGAPAGDFDLAHLRAIHKHLFQDLYDWAGELRTVEIAKDGRHFQFRRSIETGMADVHRRLKGADFLRGLSRAAFAEASAPIMGDVNYVHPFREGNGRAAQAGHALDLRLLDPARWLDASRASHDGDYGPMAAEIGRISREAWAPRLVENQQVSPRDAFKTFSPRPDKLLPRQALGLGGVDHPDARQCRSMGLETIPLSPPRDGKSWWGPWRSRADGSRPAASTQRRSQGRSGPFPTPPPQELQT